MSLHSLLAAARYSCVNPIGFPSLGVKHADWNPCTQQESLQAHGTVNSPQQLSEESRPGTRKELRVNERLQFRRYPKRR